MTKSSVFKAKMMSFKIILTSLKTYGKASHKKTHVKIKWDYLSMKFYLIAEFNATKLLPQIVFESSTKIDKNTTSILNCNFFQVYFHFGTSN